MCLFARWPFIISITVIKAPDHFHSVIVIHWIPMVLFVTHFIQDRTSIIKFWMTRVNRQRQFCEPPMAPWSMIVVDNVWHIVTIWATWRIFTCGH